MDKTVIDQFWRSRAAQHGGRWTDPAMVEHELALLAPLLRNDSRILDLGSGPAVLSCRLLGTQGKLTAVDKYQGFLDDIPRDPRVTTICCDVLAYDSPAPHDLILLFGVVTHLDLDEEVLVYQRAAAALAPQGSLVVKNQVSRSAEKRVDTYSEQLQCRYVGRYPDIPGQAERLRACFRNVETSAYPAGFDTWPDTTHVAFICSAPFQP